MDGRGVAAVMPGVALDELWRVVSVVENALALVGALASLAALLSVAAVLLVSLQGRRREFAVLRSLGLSPAGLLKLIVVETTLVVMAGLVLGGTAQQLLVFLSADWLRTELGLVVSMLTWPAEAWWTFLTILVAAILIGAIPAWRAYRISLADGLSPPSIG
jgi:putative ABC transport system permease protein